MDRPFWLKNRQLAPITVCSIRSGHFSSVRKFMTLIQPSEICSAPRGSDLRIRLFPVLGSSNRPYLSKNGLCEHFQKDSSIDSFSCYDKEAVTDNGELVCNECFDPTNPYLDIDEDLEDDAYVHICSPGSALTILSTKCWRQNFGDGLWLGIFKVRR